MQPIYSADYAAISFLTSFIYLAILICSATNSVTLLNEMARMKSLKQSFIALTTCTVILLLSTPDWAVVILESTFKKSGFIDSAYALLDFYSYTRHSATNISPGITQ